jgi:spore germination cell wall hydrolase CwlJ-like protein
MLAADGVSVASEGCVGRVSVFMSASRYRRKGRARRPLGFAAFVLVAMPTPIGYQDLAALIARQPGVSQRARAHVLGSPFGTIHAAMFAFPRPLGSAMPAPLGYQLANFDPRSLDVTGSIPNSPRFDPLSPPPAPVEFPTVDRRLKGDLLVPRQPQPPEAPKAKPGKERDTAQDGHSPPKVQSQAGSPKPVQKEAVTPSEQFVPSPAARDEVVVPNEQLVPPQAARDDALMSNEQLAAPQAAPERAASSVNEQSASPPADLEIARPLLDEQISRPGGEMASQKKSEAPPSEVLPKADIALSLDLAPQLPAAAAEQSGDVSGRLDAAATELVDTANPAMRMARLFFGADLAESQAALEPWAPGEAPVLVGPRPPADPEIKRSAIEPATAKEGAPESKPGETIAAKGEVTGEGKRPMTPAERLGLTGKARANHERCLANAIYFESRGEAERGQIAVAQVIMNRTFSGYYPDNVCGVVYQNAHRHLACQFTFACDGIPDVVTEPDAWAVATRIARDTLDGKLWLPEVGKATHYHAHWVRPSWVNEMKRMWKFGVHTFYRPRAWGSGAEAPVWGDAPAPAPEKVSATPSAAEAKL